MRLLLSFSSGKDSAWALSRLRAEGAHEVVGLLATVTRKYDRVSMHGVRREVVEAQAESADLPLHTIEIPHPCPNEVYEARTRHALERLARKDGIEGVAFGDLFLEDVRAYRERLLEPTPLAPCFPLWGEPTRELAERMIEEGLEAYVAVVDPKRLPREAVGRRFDRAFLDDLPEGVDPCAENGEFHTVVAWAPGWKKRLDLTPGEVIEREGFVFRDYLTSRPAPAFR